MRMCPKPNLTFTFDHERDLCIGIGNFVYSTVCMYLFYHTHSKSSYVK